MNILEAIESLEQYVIFGDFDDITGLYFVRVPEIKLSTCGKDKLEAMKNLASEYMKKNCESCRFYV